MRKYFGTDGIRRIANRELSPEFIVKIAKAGAYVLSKNLGYAPTILIGKDTRISGDMIESAMVAGFCSFGAKVKLLGVIPTPAVAYLVKRYNADAGVVISASHNPFEFNGIKYFSKAGMKLPDEVEEEIEDVMDSGILDSFVAEHHKMGTYEHINGDADYIEFITKTVHLENPGGLTIGLDTANGAMYATAKKTFEKLGIPCKVIHNTPNGININDKCGSTHIESLQSFVSENKLDAGFAFDGDGDRCWAVDENGESMDGDKMMAIVGKWMNEEGKLDEHVVVATVDSNMGLKKSLESNGIQLVQTITGDRYVLEEMLKNGYKLGGEQSGHIIFLDHNPTGDGLLTALQVLQVMLKERAKLSDLAKVIRKFPQVNVPAKVADHLKKTFKDDPVIAAEIKKVEAEFSGNGRVMVRASGTEPVVRVMIEGEDETTVTERANILAVLIMERLRG